MTVTTKKITGSVMSVMVRDINNVSRGTCSEMAPAHTLRVNIVLTVPRLSGRTARSSSSSSSSRALCFFYSVEKPVHSSCTIRCDLISPFRDIFEQLGQSRIAEHPAAVVVNQNKHHRVSKQRAKNKKRKSSRRHFGSSGCFKCCCNE